jgi:YggT family protein
MIELLAYVLNFISYLITLYVYVVIASVILSWLMAFGVVNPYNPTVRAIWQALNAVTEPLLRPIRNMLPNLGAIDLSPVVLLLACFFLLGLIGLVLFPLLVRTACAGRTGSPG